MSDEVVNSIGKVSLSEDSDEIKQSTAMDVEDNAPTDNADDSLVHPDDSTTTPPEDAEKVPRINVSIRFVLPDSEDIEPLLPFLDTASLYNLHRDIKRRVSVKLLYKTMNYKEDLKAIKEMIINGSPVEKLDVVGIPVDPPAQVIVMNIPESTTEDLLQALFSEATKITMPKTGDGRSKGCAMLLFPTKTDADLCVQQNAGVKIEEQNLVMEVKILPVPVPEPKIECQVVVTNLPETATDSMLEETFTGHIKLTLPKTKDGLNKGVAMVIFPSQSIAEKCLKDNEGLKIGENVVKMEIKTKVVTPRKDGFQGQKRGGGAGRGRYRGQRNRGGPQQQQEQMNGAPKRTNSSNIREQDTTKRARMDSQSGQQQKQQQQQQQRQGQQRQGQQRQGQQRQGQQWQGQQRQGGGDPAADVANRMAIEMAAKMELMQQRMTERIISQVTSNIGMGGGGRTQSLMAMGGKAAQTPKQTTPTVKCFKCGQTGHRVQQCRKNIATNTTGGRRSAGALNTSTSSTRGQMVQTSPYRDNKNRDTRLDLGILGVPRYNDYSAVSPGRGLLGGYQSGYRMDVKSSDNYMRGLERPYTERMSYTY